MTGSAQIVHVALKDVRVARWWIAGWLLLLAAAFADAVRVPISDGLEPGMIGLLTVAGAMLVTAVFVQQDAPLEADAFWTTRPLSPHAVWLAKLLAVTVVVILPALATQAAAFAVLDAGAARVARVIAGSAPLLTLWVSLAMAVAASTRNLRFFVLAVLAILIGIMTILTVRIASSDAALAVARPFGSHHPLWRAVWPLLLIAIPAWHYQRRLPRLRLPAILLAGVITVNATLAQPAARWTAAPDAPADAIDMFARIVSRGELHDGVVQYTLAVEAPDARVGHRHAFSGSHAYIQRQDGGRDVVGILRSGVLAPVAALPDGTIHLAVDLQAPEIRLLESGIGQLVITGDFLWQQEHALPLLPLEVGSVVSSRGTRAALASWQPSLAIADVVATHIGEPWPRSPQAFRFALVDGTGGAAALPLRAHQSHVSHRLLVLPWGAAVVERFRMQPEMRAGPAAGPGAAATEVPSLPMLRITEWQEVDRRVARITVRQGTTDP